MVSWRMGMKFACLWAIKFMKTNKKQIILIAIVILLIAAIAWFYINQSSKTQTTNKTSPIIVTVTPITYHISELTIRAYGTTVSPTSMAIRAQENAEIIAIYFKPGQAVTKGQLLFKLKVSGIEEQQKKLKAQMLQTKSYYLRLQEEHQKLPGIVAEYDLLKARTQYQQDLASYQQLLRLENIRAPIDGMISDTNYSAGDTVATGTKLTQITDPGSLQVKYQLPSKYVKQARIGQTIRFYPDGTEHVYKGTISYISPQFDSDSYGLTIRADLEKFADLKPNHFGQVVQIINPNYKTLAIPQSLVHNDAQGFYVYIIQNNKVAKNYFMPGAINKEGLIQVLSGIKPNTPVINSDQSILSSGLTVQVGS